MIIIEKINGVPIREITEEEKKDSFAIVIDDEKIVIYSIEEAELYKSEYPLINE